MLYVRFPLSLRNVEDLLHERGVDVSHETVRFWVSLRRRPSDFGFDPMVSPTLCPTLSTALKSKFCLQPMVIAAGIGQMMTNCALWRKALSATDKRQQQRVGMAFAGRC